MQFHLRFEEKGKISKNDVLEEFFGFQIPFENALWD